MVGTAARFYRLGRSGVPAAESSMPQRAFVLGAALRKRRFDPRHPFPILKYRAVPFYRRSTSPFLAEQFTMG